MAATKPVTLDRFGLDAERTPVARRRGHPAATKSVCGALASRAATGRARHEAAAARSGLA